MNFDKLAHIKQKYGYSSQISTLNEPKTQICNHKKQQSEISFHIEQKLKSSRPKQPKQIQQFQHSHQSNIKRYGNSVTSAQKQFSFNSNTKNNTFKALELLFDASSNQKVLQESQNIPKKLENSNFEKQSFIEAYENTYDLLKNYRQKIITSFQNQQQNKKILQIDSKKQYRKEINKQNQSPKEKKLNDKFQLARQESLHKQKQNHRGYHLVKMGKSNRQNLFEGIDVNRIDLKTELNHIQQLQNKIQSVLGFNSK